MGSAATRGALAALVLLCASPALAEESPFLQRARALAGIEGPRLARLARTILTRVVADGDLDPDVPVPEAKQVPAPFGIFVTLVRGGHVRGCFGTMEPLGKTLEALVTEATLGAARFDRRSAPLRPAELERTQIILSVVGPPTPVITMSEVDPKRHGLLVRAGDKSSVLLPGEAKTASWQLRRSLRQAGIRRGQTYEMFRFRTVTVYERTR